MPAIKRPVAHLQPIISHKSLSAEYFLNSSGRTPLHRYLADAFNSLFLVKFDEVGLGIGLGR
jgi:hypothetical protein